MIIKHHESTRSIFEALDSTPILVSIDIDRNVEHSDHVVFTYSVEIGGFDTTVKLTHVNDCYPKEHYDHAEGHHEWDTPKIEFGSIDAFYGTFKPNMIGKVIEVVLTLHAHINER